MFAATGAVCPVPAYLVARPSRLTEPVLWGFGDETAWGTGLPLKASGCGPDCNSVLRPARPRGIGALNAWGAHGRTGRMPRWVPFNTYTTTPRRMKNRAVSDCDEKLSPSRNAAGGFVLATGSSSRGTSLAILRLCLPTGVLLDRRILICAASMKKRMRGPLTTSDDDIAMGAAGPWAIL